MKLGTLILLAALPCAAQQREYDLQAPPPPPPSGTGASITSGNPGNNFYCWWIVARFPIGNSGIGSPYCMVNAPAIGSGANAVQVSWGEVPGRTTFDVLRTTTSAPPSGTGNYAVATALNATTFTDNVASPSSYTVTAAKPAAATILLNNRDFATPQVVIPGYPLNVTSLVYPDGTTQSTATVPGAGSVTNTAGPLVNLNMMAGRGGQDSQTTNITTDSGLNNINAPGYVTTGGATAPATPSGVGAAAFWVQGANYFAIGIPTTLSQQFTWQAPNALPPANSFPLTPAPNGSNVSQWAWGTFGATITCSGNVCGLANTAVTPGTYGDPTHTASITIDGQGRVTAASNTTIQGTNPCVAGSTCVIAAQNCTSAGLSITGVTHQQGSYPFVKLFLAGTANRIFEDSRTLNTGGNLTIKCSSAQSVDVYISGTALGRPVAVIQPGAGSSVVVTQDQHDFFSTDLEVQFYDRTSLPWQAMEPDTYSVNATTYALTITTDVALTPAVLVAHK